MTTPPDTIAAVATAPGRGGVGIVRVSGPRVCDIAQGLIGRLPVPRRAGYAHFRDERGAVIDSGIALYFPGPHSYTGEDVLELQGHGGPVVLDLLLQRALALGARLARPGEFTERAFLNDKLDLAQAEAVADLIAATSVAAARAAQRSLEGEFSRRIQTLVEAVIHLRMYVEAAIDFPEEDIDFLSDGRVAAELTEIRAQLDALLTTAQQGCLLREGAHVVIAGKPNAGKSSLLNALAQRETAIVTDVPGTTRDVLREHIHIDGLPLHIMDTAGLRDAADAVERIGIERARAEMERADHILLVVEDGAQTERPSGLPRKPLTIVRNKIDITGRTPGCARVDEHWEVALSARSGAGLDELKAHLKEALGYRGGESSFLARRRHLQALEHAAAAFARGRDALISARAGEVLAEELREAQKHLSEITGEFTSGDLLGRIFSNFCIGK